MYFVLVVEHVEKLMVYEQVEESLAKQFQAVKAQQVRGALQSWLAPQGVQKSAPLPQGLRDAAMEFATALVRPW